MAKANGAPGGLTPAKLGIIVVLSIILLVAIVMQFGGQGKSRRAAQRTQAAAATTKTTVGATIRGAQTVAREQRDRWPDYELNDLLAHNPFSLPKSLRSSPSPEVEVEVEASEDVPVAASIRERRRRQADLMASLREQGVDMVLVTPHGRVARVGETTYREGDHVEGLIVKEITAEGIVFVQESGSGQP